MNFNKVIIVGRLTQEPELRNTSSGIAVCSFGVATNRVWKDRESGEQKRETEFHSVVAWRRLAEIISRYLNKGSLILVEGRLQTRSWEDSSGNQRKTTEIVAESVQLPPKNMDQGQARPTRKPQKARKTREQDIPVIEEEEIEESGEDEDEEEIRVEDIPF